MTLNGDPHHSILSEPWRWELVEFSYRCEPADWRESYIDIVFARDGEQRRLLFFGPRDIELSRGLPNSAGLCILDVSGRQLDGLKVRVASFEQLYGTPSFWAERVVEIKE